MMQQYMLRLFRKDDRHVELRIMDSQQQLLHASPSIEQGDIDLLLALAESQYRIHAPQLEEQGRTLFDWIDRHSGGWLRRVRQTPQPLALHIDVTEGGLRHLPWELLHDGTGFLCADPIHWFTPLRRVSASNQAWQAQTRQLGILFMASSPQDVSPVLEFEAEEAAILNATRQRPLDLQVEESGSLAGLELRLADYREAPDVLHLTGHADVLNSQPVFLLEDELGHMAVATPQELARSLAESGNQPRLVFLSGCRTGQSQFHHNLPSFSEQLVQAGVPVVLGWALPVGDTAASSAAAALYEKLAAGFSIPEALAFARQQLWESNSPYWHLLRGYADASPPNPLVAKGRLRIRVHDTPQVFLDAGGISPVCPRTRFVGHRRLLQACLRTLRALPGDADYAEGILLHGMGGLGKSSAAARLVDRLRPSHEPVVCYGGLDEMALIAALIKVVPTAKDLLNEARQDLYERLCRLFEPTNANPYTGEKSLLLVFDDFEQNIPLEQRRRAQAAFTPPSLTTLNAVLRAIHDSQGDVRLIVTSRFAVPVPPPFRLYPTTPGTLLDADLAKKLVQLDNFQQADPSTQARVLALAAGNPRLLEWLDVVLQQQTRLDSAQLLDRLEQEEAHFREEVLIQALVEAQPSAVRRALACAALFHVPVGLPAVQCLTEDPLTQSQLQAAAQVGLVEITTLDGQPNAYYVSSLLDAALEPELAEAERTRLSAKAAQHLLDTTADDWPEPLALEIVRLAEIGQAPSIAVKVGDPLAFSWFIQDRYREAEALCLRLLALGEDFRILTTLARAQQRLGKDGFNQQIERAALLLPTERAELSDKDLLEVAYTLGAKADILQSKGQLDEALRIREQEELPVYERLGDVRSKAVTLGQIADILQARGQLDEALHIREQEQLPVYERLGDVRSKAVTLGKIAGIWQARGQPDEALRIREQEELPVYERLGDVRSLLVGRANLAMLLLEKDAEGNRQRSIDLLVLALADARRLRLPEAGQIEGRLRQLDWREEH